MHRERLRQKPWILTEIIGLLRKRAIHDKTARWKPSEDHFDNRSSRPTR